MKRNPRKLRWTKSFRAAAGKEMTIDSTLTFASKRNIPVRYDRDLMNTTLHAMSRVSEIRAKRERVFYRKRMQGNKERQREADRKLVAENEHLLPRQRASERLAEELVDGLLDERELRNEGEKEERRERISGMVRARVKQRLLVDGDIEEEGMDVD
ncbi:ATPase-activating ribosome biosynthesis protein [Agyrium rufum]|nr:ATPase-activating ribosome biosynthesis protein [Agyrium rufum]